MILNFTQIEPTHIMENIIYNELWYRSFNVVVEVIESTEKIDCKNIRKNYEIDFIATLGSKNIIYNLRMIYLVKTKVARRNKIF